MGLLEKLLIRDEGFKSSVYQDHLGYWTLGIGRLVDARKGGGITKDEALFLLRNDITKVGHELRVAIPWWNRLNEVRQIVLISMAFQMGVAGLLGFRNTLRAIRDERWADAKAGMLASLWARQVPLRAHRLAEAMYTGSADAFQLDEDPS